MDDKFIREVQIDWNQVAQRSYLRAVPCLAQLKRLTFQKNITLFAGENGTGKSTLLEAIAVAYGFNPEGGTKNYHFSTFDDVSELNRALQITKGHRKAKAGYFFRAESFFNVATQAEEYRGNDLKAQYYRQYGGKSLHEQSHGESFLAYLQSFSEPGLYIMDEPEAALSPQRQLTLFLHIVKMAEAGSQFIIASHSPIVLGMPDAEILSFQDNGIVPCAYEDTESYQITEMFINHRGALIHQLLQN